MQPVVPCICSTLCYQTLTGSCVFDVQDIASGSIQHWNTQPAPDVAIRYWKLAVSMKSKLSDVGDHFGILDRAVTLDTADILDRAFTLDTADILDRAITLDTADILDRADSLDTADILDSCHPRHC